jgi:RNA polymerase sigma-70 factor, ECF subfamily
MWPRLVDDAEQEFSRFFREQFAAVVQTTTFILHDRDRARDITQDAFIELLTRWKRISTYDRPEAWVRRVAIRMAVRTLRRDQLRRRLERDVEPIRMPGPVDIDLVRAVGQLPPSLRAAVALFYFEDRPVAEVADILGCSEVTARGHLHRARIRLATLLGEEAVDVT